MKKGAKRAGTTQAGNDPNAALSLVIASLDRFAELGVRVFEMGEGAGRVRVELAPRPQTAEGLVERVRQVAEVDLIRETAQRIVQGSARAPSEDAQQADPTEATRSPKPEGEDAEQAGDELDLAHLG